MAEHPRGGHSVSGFERALDVWNRRKWLVTAVFTVMLVGLLAVIWALPPMYRSTAIVLVERMEVPEAFVRASVTGELEPRLDWVGQEVLSRARLEEVMTRYDLYPRLRERDPSAEAAVQQMRKDIQFAAKATQQPGKNTTIAFSLSYLGFAPDSVARVTNALASSYVQENLKVRQRQATGTAQFLQAQLAEMKLKLEEQERRLGEQPLGIETELAALERYNTRLKINTDRQLRALDRRERLLRGMDMLASPVGGGEYGGPETIGARLLKLKHELTELRTRFSDKYPEVIRVKGEIAALERRLAVEPEEAALERSRPRSDAASAGARPSGPRQASQGRDPIKEIDNELQGLKQEEKTLRQAITTYEQRAQNAPKQSEEYQRRARDYAILKEEYRSLLKRYEDARMAEDMEQRRKGEEFRILDTALPPKEPLAPNRVGLGLASLILSMGGAAGAAVTAEAFDGSFHSVDELLRAFGKVPVLADIPRLVAEGDAARRRRRRWMGAIGLLVLLALVVGAAYLFAHDNEQLVRFLALAGRVASGAPR